MVKHLTFETAALVKLDYTCIVGFHDGMNNI